MPRYLFSSHDGFGMGHVRRNVVVAKAVLAREPGSHVTLVTGLAAEPSWLQQPGMSVHTVPPLLKSTHDGYHSAGMSFHEAVDGRRRRFSAAVEACRPDVVVVDRHPFGVAGELRSGLEAARRAGARVVLGLRDILDEPDVVVREMAGEGWHGVGDLFDEIVVYGSAAFCDHEREYGLAIPPRYCGWVVEHVPGNAADPRLLVIAAGGGGDGAEVFDLGLALLEQRPQWRGVVVPGPYADVAALRCLATTSPARHRVEVATGLPGCGPLFAAAAATLQMAGYNSTFEALAAGRRPILVPRVQPRREQWLRAVRLSRLDLADVVDEGARPADVAALLDGPPRLLADGDLDRAGISLDGAGQAAAMFSELARSGMISATGIGATR